METNNPPAAAPSGSSPFRRRLAFSILAAAGAAWLTVAAWPNARLFTLWAVQRANGCSCGDSVRSHKLLVDMETEGERIGRASRVIERDPAGFELLSTPMGQYWTVRNDRFLRFTLAEESLEIYGSDEDGVRPGDVVLDCGANVGVFTRTALARGASLVVAIEPTPSTVECLRRNFRKEVAAGRVIVYPKGVWDRVDTLELAVGTDGNTTGNSLVFGRDLPTRIKVPLTTIDLLAEELHLPRVDFIKMDIEGAEKPALRGATGTIRKFHPRMAISSEHLPDDVAAIPGVVRGIAAGYAVRASDCKDNFLAVQPEVLLFNR